MGNKTNVKQQKYNCKNYMVKLVILRISVYELIRNINLNIQRKTNVSIIFETTVITVAHLHEANVRRENKVKLSSTGCPSEIKGM